ncbi:FtsX-like permease family protein [Fredinandcohnia sp. QZ13]|uniref:ABC transporter permease n=1 Tax=Fredinandcohnia sp. QZ13 TaxID=3073144 RepID=UPI00285367BB|nr:FtsX-like permease family protein [Fredinandcohnia sp. QZ13]MDR4887370.1 FtsX-like permease family protein [Fredinandcohnia sp. QZ13]
MNIINKLTIRHLKENKRRTLVTIIGVIISVAMISAVATLGVSFLNLMIRDHIATNGEWHVKYNAVNEEQIQAIENDDQTKKLILSNDLGYAKLERSENKGKPYLFFKEYNSAGFQQFPIELAEGRLPFTENEIVISEDIANNAKVAYNIGDKLTLDIGKRMLAGEENPLGQNYPLQTDENGTTEELKIQATETFTIVGTIKRPTWEQAWSPGYTVIKYVDKNALNSTRTVDAVVVLEDVKGSLYKHSETIAKENGINSVSYNDDLLRFYGVTNNDNLRMTLFSLAGIIMAVVIIGSVALIYNAFAISVSERSRHLGMLSSVGATRKQKRNSVFFEGAVIGAISIPIGILSGLAGIGVTFSFINSYLEGALNVSEKLKVIVTPASLIVACLISIITIFISTYIPAKRASKVSAIDAIRQTQDIKLSRKSVKTSKMVRKLFGIEAEIGLKNLKRNKKRYQATVFSLVISIVLFLTVSFFTENLKKSLELSQENINFDIQVINDQMDKDDLLEFTNLDYVTESTIVQTAGLMAWIEEDQLPHELKKQVENDPSMLKDGKYFYYVRLHGLDKESFEKYAVKVGTDSSQFANTETPTAIIVDHISYQDYESGKFVETKSIETKVGNTIDLVRLNYENDEEQYVNTIEIGALTTQLPMGISSSGPGGLDIIVSEDVLTKIVSDSETTKNEIQAELYMNSSNPMATQEELDKMTDSGTHVYNVYQRRQEQEQMVVMISIFTYGFIALISLISIANIFNTISTSISLRKREFAMLRSVGMTPKGFNKMINYESIFYGVKALLYGLPISLAVMYLIYWSLRNTFEYGFNLPWVSILFVVIIIFVIVGAAMLYSIQKIKKENIIDGLKQESI